MKNINRDYLVKVNAKTAKITPPKDMKFFMTDILTCNIFFQLIFDDSENSLISNHAPQQNAEHYSLTLRVVKPNNATRAIKATLLSVGKSFFVADLTTDFVDIPGIYECELFIDTEIADQNGVLRLERSTTDSFEYEVKESVFFNLDDIVEYEGISIDNIATIDYVNSLAVGGVGLKGYATTLDLNNKANKEHTHDEYITQDILDDVISEIDCSELNLEDFTVSNSISIKRVENSIIGQYSVSEGDNTAATGYASHSEGYNTIASGKTSHAEGNSTKAIGYSAHAEGYKTLAGLDSSHAEGYDTIAAGYASHSEGYSTKAFSDYQHVQGKFNIEDSDEIYAHIVGNGFLDDEGQATLSNAHTLDWDGNAWFAGNVKIGDNKLLATQEYVNRAIISAGGSFGEGGEEYIPIPPYDDTELRSDIAQLEIDVATTANDIRVLEADLVCKTDKRVFAERYEYIDYINFGDIELDNDRKGNYRQIRILNPQSQLRIELPETLDSDFAEIHAYIVPMSNSVDLSIDINNDTEHSNIKLQDGETVPNSLDVGRFYEFVFTYIECGYGSNVWLLGAIIYE